MTTRLSRMMGLWAVGLAGVLCADIAAGAEKGPGLPLQIGKTWNVFLMVTPPKTYGSIPETLPGATGADVKPVTTALKDGRINLTALNKGTFVEGGTAVLYNEFTCEKAGRMRIGVAADWWLEAYLNGRMVCSTMKSGNGAITYTPDDHPFEMPVQAGRNLLAVKVLSGSAGWQFVCGVASPPKPNITFTADAEWRPVDMSDVRVKPGSALDLTAVSALPGGESKNFGLSRLICGPTGRLAAADRPEQPIRLRGYTFPDAWLFPSQSPDIKAEITEHARLSRLQGYNFTRFFIARSLSQTEDMSYVPELLDRVDYVIAQFKQHGIYFFMPISLALKNDAAKWNNRRDITARMYLGDPEMRRAWQYAAETLLNHVNPYTGLAWKDEPAIACVEFYNEQAGGLCWSDFSPAVQTEFNTRFQDWLKKKYETPQNLAQAWGETDLTAFSQVAAPSRLKAARDPGNRDRDFVLFCTDLARENLDWYEATVRATGYAGLTAQYNIPAWLGACAVRFERSQVAIRNSYFNHPSNQSSPGSRCQQNSSAGTQARYWRSANATRFADRPFMITEFNHAFWNPYQHECGLLYPAYSGFQGFDALVTHQSPVVFEVGRNSAWTLGNSPIARANEFLSACLFLRGDVQLSPHRVELGISQEELGEYKVVSSAQDRIALMCGFSVSFPGAPRPHGVGTPPPPDLAIALSEGANVSSTTGWSFEVLDTQDKKFSLDAFVADLKGRGLLPAGNLTDPAHGVFQTDTGEITLRTEENLIKVATPRTEAVSLENGRSETIGCLAVAGTDTPALVAACAMDGETLERSRRMVLLYSTDTVNTDMEVSPDRVTLINLGKTPALMKVGRLNATLKNANAGRLKLYALGFDGARREELPLDVSGDTLQIVMDTGTLKNGPTPFFELVAEGRGQDR